MQRARSLKQTVLLLFAFLCIVSLIAVVSAVPPVADFTGSPTTGYFPISVHFTDSSTGSPTGWAWYFGDENYAHTPWNTANWAALWSARFGHTSVAMPDGSIVLMGGNDGTSRNDTWRSPDNGATWTLQTAAAGWSARSGHTSVAMADGSIVLMGGNALDGLKNDVWRSIDNSATWTRQTAAAGWSARSGHTSVAMPDGSIVLVGGNALDGRKNDVWKSIDNGATWAEITANAAWSARYAHTSVAMPDGSIVLVGGNALDGLKNDVWRSIDNGATWTEITANATWAARSGHGTALLPDGSIILMGGMTPGGSMNDVWRSADVGNSWTQLDNGPTGWTGRGFFSSHAMPDGSIMLMGGTTGGMFRNDVYRFVTARSTDQNPYYMYMQPGSYEVLLQVYNTGGYNRTHKTGYITVTGYPSTSVTNFTGSPRSGTAPLNVQFNDTSTDTGITAYQWLFSDSATVYTTQNLTHSFLNPGVYNVNHSTTNISGLAVWKNVTAYISVTGTGVAPVASFSCSPQSATVPFIVQFNDTSTGEPTSWNWNFGDGQWYNTTVSTGRNVTHTYTTPGSYIAQLTVANSGGTGTTEPGTTITANPSVSTSVSKFRADLQNTGVYDDGGTRPGNTLKWSYDTWSTGIGSSPAVANGVVYIGGGWDNKVHAFNAATGVPLWNYTTGDRVHSSPAVVDGVVYVGSYDNNIYALNAVTGTQIWNYTTLGNMYSSPAVANGIVYVGILEGMIPPAPSKIYALNAATGAKLWDFTTGSYIFSSPAVANGIVYVGSDDNKLYALNAVTGAQVWIFNSGVFGGGAFGSSPAVANGVVYVGCNNGKVYALDALTGANLWDYTTQGVGGEVSSSPAVANGVVYVGCNNGKVYALNAVTGTQIWNYTTMKEVISSPAVANGALYVGSGDGKVYALDAATGAKLWDYTTQECTMPGLPCGVKSSPAVANGVVYVGGGDGKLYAIGNGGTTLPVADFTANVTLGIAPLSVRFNDTSTGGATAWNWNFKNGSRLCPFGDGPFSTEQNPVFTYTEPGMYNVSLNVTNSAGSNFTVKYGYITVTEAPTVAPVADFTASPRSGTAPLIVQFTDTSTGPPSLWNWSFGDGISSTLRNPVHTYAGAGTYTISLYVTNAGGSDTKTSVEYITVTPGNETYEFRTKWGSDIRGDGQLGAPFSVTADSSGNVYVADAINQRVQKFSSLGTFLAKWGTQGSGDGQFQYPKGITVDSSGNVYVLDTDNNRIQKFSSSGTFLAKWGTQGSGVGQFQYPNGIAVDSSGNVYVADTGNQRVQKFSSSGTFLAKWGKMDFLPVPAGGQPIGNISFPIDGLLSYPTGIAVDISGNIYVADQGYNSIINKYTPTGVFLTKWGTRGTGDGQFLDPFGIAVDSSGNVYLTDGGNERVQKFSSTGTFLTTWGTEGPGNGQFQNPRGIAADSSGNVYVADAWNQRVQKFDSIGSFLTKWGSQVSGDGQFNYPYGTAIDPLGNLYVSDVYNHRIQKFSSSGAFLTKWGSHGSGDGQFNSLSGIAMDSLGNVYVIDSGNNRVQKFNSTGAFLATWGTEGSGDGEFLEPRGIAIDSSGNVYIIDSQNNRVQKFSSSGTFLTKWGTQGSEDGQFNSPSNIAVDTLGNVYVTDSQNNRVQKFGPDGTFLAKWGAVGTADGQFEYPSNIAVDSLGNLFVTDSRNQRVQKFNSNGIFITKWGLQGSGDGQFNYPAGVAVDSSGNVYVADSSNLRIQKFAREAILAASFTGSPRSGTAPLNVQFNDTSMGTGITGWQWIFSDGATVYTTENLTHTFTNTGTYSVNHSITNSSGTTWKNETGYITVTVPVDAPVADFTGTPTTGPAPLNVQFTDTSTGTPTGWAWFFGDETYMQAWTSQTPGAEWSARSASSSVVMPDGSIILMGGYDTVSPKNDTWRSTNNGTTWTQQTANAGWPARWGHSSVVIPDGSVILMGGYGSSETLYNDVWRSMDYGVTWTEMNASAGWTARFYHNSVVMPDGSIILMGGADAGGAKNDTWRSTDSGATWAQQTWVSEINWSDINWSDDNWSDDNWSDDNTGWSPRVLQSSVAMPDGSIILMGGGDAGGPKNDTWMSTDNGATWTQQTASAGWSARQAQSSVVMPDGSIVLMGGLDGSYNQKNDVWQSTDNGATWTYLTASAGWPARGPLNSVVIPDGSIILMGGYGSSETRYNDVWRFVPTGSPVRSPLHTYTTPGTYQVALQAYKASGYNSTRKTGYITVTGSPSSPVADFTGSPRSGTAPLNVQFNDTSTGTGIMAYQWIFSDGATVYTIQNLTHTFTSTGTYHVNHSVTSSAGTTWKNETGYITVAVVLPFPKPSGGYFPPPTDPNHDGLFEDLDGNGWIGFNDVVVYYNNMDNIDTGLYGPIVLFDYDHSGFIGFNDVVHLYGMIG